MTAACSCEPAWLEVSFACFSITDSWIVCPLNRHLVVSVCWLIDRYRWRFEADGIPCVKLACYAICCNPLVVNRPDSYLGFACSGRMYVRFLVAHDSYVGREGAFPRKENEVAWLSELVVNSYPVVIPKFIRMTDRTAHAVLPGVLGNNEPRPTQYEPYKTRAVKALFG